MIHRSNILGVLLMCFSVGALNAGMISSALAGQKEQIGHNQPGRDRIYGKVTQTMDTTGYTYAEVDTGEEKFWAAARKTVLKIGDMIAFSPVMPMERYYSKSLKREFPVVYFVDRFVTDKDSMTNKHAVKTSPHAKIKVQQVIGPVIGINKVEDGHTIADIYKNKLSLKGKTIRVRGKVTKFTAKVMGKNWLHIRDSSTLNDLTVTTDKLAAINDVVVIEGKLELDKNYNYGYIYSVIVENANIFK